MISEKMQSDVTLADGTKIVFSNTEEGRDLETALEHDKTFRTRYKAYLLQEKVKGEEVKKASLFDMYIGLGIITGTNVADFNSWLQAIVTIGALYWVATPIIKTVTNVLNHKLKIKYANSLRVLIESDESEKDMKKTTALIARLNPKDVGQIATEMQKGKNLKKVVNEKSQNDWRYAAIRQELGF